ncbi:MAG TPA: uridine kinase [Verrucomicrobiae bacterium]|nr:uridine kinase [Verrucomicrobiae bacterium]
MSRTRSAPTRRVKPRRRTPLLVAIVGGSGSGKSWLADQLANALHPHTTRLSQDDFYRDRSGIAASRRAAINFDHPRAIEWPELERAVLALAKGQRARIPCYDFKTHSRLRRPKTVVPKRIVLIDGLWLLRRRSLRMLYGLTLFLNCSTQTRLRRRLTRDLRSRGRRRNAVLHQFWTTVEPMHVRYVAPQARFADLILSGTETAGRIKRLAQLIQRLERAAVNERIQPGVRRMNGIENTGRLTPE